MTVIEWSDKLRETIETLIQAEFGAAMPTVAMVFENTRREHPKEAPWIYTTIVEGKSRRVNIGAARQFGGHGVVNVQIMVPENTGTKTLRRIGDAVFNILADRQLSMPGIGSITLCDVEKRGRPPVNGWLPMNVMATYYVRFELDRADIA